MSKSLARTSQCVGHNLPPWWLVVRGFTDLSKNGEDLQVLICSSGPDYTIYRIKTLNEVDELSNLYQMIPTNIISKGMECYFISYCYKTAIPKTKTCLCWQTISPSLKTFKAHYDREKMF